MPYRNAEDRKAYDKKRNREWTPEQLEARRAYDRKHAKEMKEWREKQGQAYKDQYRKGALLRKYGLTEADFSAMLLEQGHKCASCGSELRFEGPHQGPQRLVVDHCHQTGKVRGLLCSACNRTIGHAREDTARLRACADYLEEKK